MELDDFEMELVKNYRAADSFCQQQLLEIARDFAKIFINDQDEKLIRIYPANNS